MINGKRVTGSLKYPTLTDDWRLYEISQGGVVIVKGKERRELAFVGPEPYQVPQSPMVKIGGGVGQQPPLPSGLPFAPTIPR